MPLAPLGHKRGSEERVKRRGLSVLYNIDTRLADGFDHNIASGRGDIAAAGAQDMIAVPACARNPDGTILTLYGHRGLSVFQAQNFAWAEK